MQIVLFKAKAVRVNERLLKENNSLYFRRFVEDCC